MESPPLHVQHFLGIQKQIDHLRSQLDKGVREGLIVGSLKALYPLDIHTSIPSRIIDVLQSLSYEWIGRMTYGPAEEHAKISDKLQKLLQDLEDLSHMLTMVDEKSISEGQLHDWITSNVEQLHQLTALDSEKTIAEKIAPILLLGYKRGK